ncbi:MAG TPA: TPM domain-containing protein, partial [Pyrinomonadaceae bacterium]|nr:TPM domain-containing protein [Pyrinomonadaceae bacterium]
MIRRNSNTFTSTLILAVALFAALASARAQESKPAPELQPTGRVNDFAGVLDQSAKERIENSLANLKERGGIEFRVVLVKSTEGRKIFDYTIQLSRQWKIGEMQSRDSSLLLLISTDDGQFLAQASRGLRTKMPEDLLGQMGTHLQPSISKGNYNEALMNAVETFIKQMAEKQGFKIEGIDQAPVTASAQTPQTTQPAPPATDTLPKETASATAEPSPSPEPTPKEPATKQAKPSQRSLREVFTKDSGTKTDTSSGNAQDKAELDALLQLPTAERIEKLKTFITDHPQSDLKTFAVELLVSAHAALGDEKLQAGEIENGLAEFAEAIAQSPDKMSDSLFVKVVSQIPINLYMRGQHTASGDAAHLIEAKVKDDPKRLLALAGFFLSVEQADEAARLSELALKLAPDMAAAHQALGASRHIALRLDDAAAEYARALELDPKLAQARRSLADLRRAAGKPEDALVLYREQLTADPTDKSARAGVVLSLLDLGKRDEAEAQMDEALKQDANNLPLLVGASYWYAAHSEAARAQELAAKAISIEPRYTWAHIALARALVLQRKPLEAERVLRFARTYGRFPTLDYELASALAASGLYEDAAA